MARERSETTPEFRARKLALETRLRREGRLEEARRFREEVRKTCKASGLGSTDAVKAAWDEMERVFPPLVVGGVDGIGGSGGVGDGGVGGVGGGVDAVVTGDVAGDVVAGSDVEPGQPGQLCPPGGLVQPGGHGSPAVQSMPAWIPKEWGRLPQSSRWEDEVDWVHQNLPVCLHERKTGNVMRLSKAMSRPPSMGAITIMQSAVKNPGWFEKDLVPKAKRGFDEGADGELAKRERKSIEEIRRILTSLEVA